MPNEALAMLCVSTDNITSLLSDLRDAGIRFNDLDTTQSSLEDIFVDLVRAS